MQEFIGAILPLVIIFGVMWFILIRPARKRQKETQAMQEALRSGDVILTISGVKGTIEAVDENAVHLRIANNVTIEIVKQAVASVVKKETLRRKKKSRSYRPAFFNFLLLLVRERKRSDKPIFVSSSRACTSK